MQPRLRRPDRSFPRWALRLWAETLREAIDAAIGPGQVWFLTEDGQVRVGDDRVVASPTDTPVDTGNAFLDALAALRDAAMAVALPACDPPEGP